MAVAANGQRLRHRPLHRRRNQPLGGREDTLAINTLAGNDDVAVGVAALIQTRDRPRDRRIERPTNRVPAVLAGDTVKNGLAPSRSAPRISRNPRGRVSADPDGRALQGPRAR